jgi:hypothetical protein
VGVRARGLPDIHLAHVGTDRAIEQGREPMLLYGVFTAGAICGAIVAAALLVAIDVINNGG